MAEITYRDAVIRGINIAGTLTFATNKVTLLNVGLIKIQAGDVYSEEGFDCEEHMTMPDPAKPRPALLIGTADYPINFGKTAHIRLHYVEGMNKESCPAIVCCGGRWETHGPEFDRTWVKLGATAKAGDSPARSAKPIAATPPSSTPARAGPGICFRAGMARPRWTKRI